jgi:hypothetical protein
VSEPTNSQYINEVDELILRAACEILRRVGGNVPDRVFDADLTTAELLSIGRTHDRLVTAGDAVMSALIALKVNAEHYPPTVPKPQSLRA